MRAHTRQQPKGLLLCFFVTMKSLLQPFPANGELCVLTFCAAAYVFCSYQQLLSLPMAMSHSELSARSTDTHSLSPVELCVFRVLVHVGARAALVAHIVDLEVLLEK